MKIAASPVSIFVRLAYYSDSLTGLDGQVAMPSYKTIEYVKLMVPTRMKSEY